MLRMKSLQVIQWNPAGLFEYVYTQAHTQFRIWPVSWSPMTPASPSLPQDTFLSSRTTCLSTYQMFPPGWPVMIYLNCNLLKNGLYVSSCLHLLQCPHFRKWQKTPLSWSKQKPGHILGHSHTPNQFPVLLIPPPNSLLQMLLELADFIYLIITAMSNLCLRMTTTCFKLVS